MVCAAHDAAAVPTSLGPVRVKIIEGPNGRRARPEFEDVRSIAQREGEPLAEIMTRIERDVADSLRGR